MDWYVLANVMHGPADKQGYSNCHARIAKGAIVHSSEGWWSGIQSRLMADNDVSWHFSVLQDGRVYQHYPLPAVCWHGGSPYPNERFAGIECEGTAGQPVAGGQFEALVTLLKWISEQEQWLGFAFGRDCVLSEHNMYFPTACPSGRIPWLDILAELEGTVADTEARTRLSTLEQKDVLRSAVDANRMDNLVQGMIFCGVLPAGTVSLKPKLDGVNAQ